MADMVYYFSKKTGEKNVLGEIQADYNLSFVMDGTKDSAKVEVFSFTITNEVEPFTILLHENTNTYWIVSNDNVERYTNETNYLYKHSLKLIGLIELLNARDLTDCGFNQNTYTIESAIERLFKLSNLENFLVLKQINVNNSFDLEQNIDYVKSFENYTLLSALRELLDGYNCVPKLDIEFNSSTNKITGTILNIYSKTGNTNTTHIFDEKVFNNVQEKKSIDKNNYSSMVVSNAENVISTKSKTFPSVGHIRLSANDFEVTNDNAILRLPSNVFKVNWVKMIIGTQYGIFIDVPNKPSLSSQKATSNNDFNSLKLELKEIVKSFALDYGESQELYDDFLSKLDKITTNFIDAMTVKINNYDSYDAMSERFIVGNDFCPQIAVYYGTGTQLLTPRYTGPLVLTPKEIRDCVHEQRCCLCWERGKDYLSGFTFLSDDLGDTSLAKTKLSRNSTEYRNGTNIVYDMTFSGVHLQIIFYDRNSTELMSYGIDVTNTSWVVDYIPMGDVKINYENHIKDRDIQLYNQNGKFTDSVALSKMLLSYSDELTSNSITKYGTYYDYDDIPKVGDIVLLNNIKYVINNVSMDFYLNEIEDYISCEFGMTKEIAVKSLLLSPNTNVRDYGIPQNYNVKRKQIYKDTYELSHNYVYTSFQYLTLSEILNVSNFYQGYKEHTALIKITYDEPIGGGGTDVDGNTIQPSDEWYYQLNTIVYAMKKSIYEIVDFKDNNIIGYDAQTIFSGFDIRRIFTGLVGQKNTPIAYVDNNGRCKNIDISMCNYEQLSEIYAEYTEEMKQEYGSSFGKTLTNYMVFIDEDIYNKSVDNRDFVIMETNYNKDAIEVPVFEYCCQMMNSEDVIIGDNVFDNNENDFVYLYSYTLTPKGIADNNNWSAFDISSVSFEFLINDYIAKVENGVGMEYNQNNLNIKLYTYNYFNITDNDNHNVGEIDFDDIDLDNNDIVIVRHTIKKVEKDVETIEKTINTSKIMGSQFAYDYEESKYIAQVYVDLNDIDFGDDYVDTSTIQVISSRISSYSGSFPGGSYCSVMYENNDRRFSILVYCSSMPSSSDYCYVEFVFSYDSSFIYINTRNDLMFVIRHTENANIENNTLTLYANHK